MKKEYKLGLLIVIIALVLIAPNGMQKINGVSHMNINTFNPPHTEILGSNDMGTVTKSGPYGNSSSKFRIAIIVGVHPLERNSHSAMAISLYSLSKSLRYSYYVYSINVFKDKYSYTNGRTNGQLLARYAVANIKKNNFTMAIDVHSNRGLYKEKRFVCAPISNIKSKMLALELKDQISWLVYYLPPKEKGPSSPNFVTVPLIKSGTPAMVYETYGYESYDLTVEHACQMIRAMDKLNLGVK